MGRDSIASLISQKRKREGIGLRDAAEASGVAFSTLARIENGATPSLRVHAKIIAWLNGEEPPLPAPPMTKHEWFVGQALAGLLANPVAFGPIMQGDPETIAAAAQNFASAANSLASAPSPPECSEGAA